MENWNMNDQRSYKAELCGMKGTGFILNYLGIYLILALENSITLA
jgi:hypothetical protein